VRILVTRPQPDGARTAAALRERGHEVLIASVLQIEPVTAVLPDMRFSAVILTSANAARALAAHPARARLTGLPVFAVGHRSAAAARTFGFTDVRSAGGDQSDLAGLIGVQRLDGPLLYLAGEDRAGDLGSALAAHGCDVHTLVIYRAVKAEGLPDEIAGALREGRIDGVLHFSRRSAEAYLSCARSAGLLAAALVPTHYCLSEHVAAAIAAAERVMVAPRPEEAALLDLVGPA
jgi:uroporphyrinogen-III synthase